MSQNEQTLGALFAEYEKNSAVTVLDAGKYKLEVTNCSPRNNGVLPTYKLVEGPGAGARVFAGGIYPGETEGGRIAFFRKLEKFGLGKEFFGQNPTLEDVAKALVGRVIEADLEVGHWQGEPRNEMGFGIKLVSAPATPAVGGVPAAAVTTTTTTPPTATPVPSATAPSSTVTAPPPGTTNDPGF